MTIGICGASGSGKSTLAARLQDAIGTESLTLLPQDSYYRSVTTLPEALRQAENFDHPDCIDFPLLIEHLTALQAGQSIALPHYDFATHQRLAATTEQPARRVIVLEGTLIFSDPALRALLPLKLFVDTAADLCLVRRIRRDTQERGRTLESVLTQYESTVRPMHQRYVAPSRQHADLIVPEGASIEQVVALLTQGASIGSLP
jgi:uridine kinase